MHPATAEILRYFEYAHLSPPLGVISRDFWVLAHAMAEQLPDKPETTVCLRKLLEAKDCAVRAAMP